MRSFASLRMTSGGAAWSQLKTESAYVNGHLLVVDGGITTRA